MSLSSAAIAAQKLEKEQELAALRVQLAETEEDMAQIEAIEEQMSAQGQLISLSPDTVSGLSTALSAATSTVTLSDESVAELGVALSEGSKLGKARIRSKIRQAILAANVQVPGTFY